MTMILMVFVDENKTRKLMAGTLNMSPWKKETPLLRFATVPCLEKVPNILSQMVF